MLRLSSVKKSKPDMDENGADADKWRRGFKFLCEQVGARRTRGILMYPEGGGGM
jgi:hypothetical protein